MKSEQAVLPNPCLEEEEEFQQSLSYVRLRIMKLRGRW